MGLVFRGRIAAVILTTVFAAGFAVVAPAQTASDRLRTLFDERWENSLRESPFLATNVGDRRFNDRLPEAGLAAERRRTDSTRAFLARLRAIPRESLSRAEQINRDIAERGMRESIESSELGGFLIPITNREGFHTSFPELHQRVPLRSTEDYRNYIARLAAFRQYSGGYIELMREGLRRGMTLPVVSLEGIEETITPHIVTDPTRSLLWKPFAEFPATVPTADRAALTSSARDAILSGVVPGYQDFLDFIVKEYRPRARKTLGASQLPNGRAYYAQRVRSYTTLDDATAESVHETGLREVARIRAAMDSVMRAAGWTGDHKSFIQFLRTDPRFYAKTARELLEKNAYFLKLMEGELPRLFGKLPRMTYGLKVIPDYVAPRTTTAYYGQPAGDGTRAGTYWVNVHDLPSRPLYEIEALASHEAVPGHHLQIALQQELTDVPMFRRFSGATAFTEGWALYSESLGKEVGFYKDPYSEFGRLSYDMWRACRLVIDTGIHSKGWTRQQAIDYLAENSALTLTNITNEVDVRAFHDVVLGSGSVPLTVLVDNVRLWIRSQENEAVK
jgi:uncharacterized protein (DUF885 family)